ncbi:MAG: hypothetical protein LC791_17155 [Acidobacteria bacterium]|nr:hypothetical protein [Acidobacteriota bacterium]
MNERAPLVEIRGLVKEYRALRPLRIQELIVRPAEIVSIAGLDAQAAEMLITLVTGASLPDAGEIRLFGRSTAEIGDSATWLRALDGVGMLSARVVLLEACSVRQNIALSLTLEIDPISAAVRERVDALARDAGLQSGQLDTPVGAVGPEDQMRVRLARALALAPSLLLAEHPSASLPPEMVAAVASDVARLARARGQGVLAISADPLFARSLGGTRLALDPATGAWRPQGMWSKVTGALSRSK